MLNGRVMFITIADVLTDQDLKMMREQIDTLSWRHGSKTAGATAKQVKRNLQADMTSQTGVKLREQLSDKITGHPVLKAAARPKRLSRLLISKTKAEGGYGLHVDNAFMGAGDTLFLSSPEEYEGGALRIEHAGHTQEVKAEAGDLVLYPSTSLHAVETVTSGVRLVCVGWIESLIRTAQDREILFDLENLRASLAQTHDPQSIEMLTLSKVFANLLRRFS